MSNSNKCPSLFAGLFWTSLGVLLLLYTFGVVSDLWSIIGHYWPVLLILFGLGKVLGFLLRRGATTIRVGEILGILLLLIIGSAISSVSQSRIVRILRDFSLQIENTPIWPAQWLENSYTYNLESSYPLDSFIPIQIENSYGLVSVVPGSDREVRVRLKKIVYSDNELRARNIAGEIRLEAKSENAGAATPAPKSDKESGKKQENTFFLIKTNRDSLNSKNYRFNTELEVFIPRKSNLQIRNNNGEIRVANIEGKLDLSTTQRLLEIKDCTGEFAVSNRHADSSLTNLSGNVTIDASGKVHLEDIKGDVNIRNEYSPVEVSDIEGKVTISNTEGSIRIENVTKPVIIDARGTQVHVEHLQDSLKLTNSHGNVNIFDVVSNITLDSRYNTLTLKNLGSNVDIDSISDFINADDIRGYMKLKGRGSAIRVNSIRGPLEIQNTLKDIFVNDFSGACKIINEYANINLSTGTLSPGEVNVKNRNGGIELTLPEGASFLMNAVARNGRVVSEYAGLINPQTLGSSEVLKASVKGGGPQIVLETDYSDIRIRSRDAGSFRAPAEMRIGPHRIRTAERTPRPVYGARP